MTKTSICPPPLRPNEHTGPLAYALCTEVTTEVTTEVIAEVNQ